MSQTKTYPGFWHAVLLCVILVAFQTAFFIPFGILDALFSLHLSRDPIVLGVANLCAFGSTLFIARLIGRPRLAEMLPVRRVSPVAVAGVVVATVGAIIIVSEADNLVRTILPIPDWWARLFEGLFNPPKNRFWATAIVLVIVAPLTEEPIFRGLFLRGFLRRFSLAKALLFSAMMFGAAHLNPWQFVSASMLGVMFGWWRARTQSLIPSLIGHALVNAGVLFNPLLPFSIRGFNWVDAADPGQYQPLWFDLLGLSLLAAGLWLFRSSTPRFEIPIEQPSEPPPLIDSVKATTEAAPPAVNDPASPLG